MRLRVKAIGACDSPSSPDSDLPCVSCEFLLCAGALHVDACGFSRGVSWALLVCNRPGPAVAGARAARACLARPRHLRLRVRAHGPLGLLVSAWACRYLSPSEATWRHGWLGPLARVGPIGTPPTDPRAVSGPSTRDTARAWWGRAQSRFGPCAAGPCGKRPGESAWPKFGLAASPLQSRLPRPGPQ
jgi:hypothetical protein